MRAECRLDIARKTAVGPLDGLAVLHDETGRFAASPRLKETVHERGGLVSK